MRCMDSIWSLSVHQIEHYFVRAQCRQIFCCFYFYCLSGKPPYFILSWELICLEASWGAPRLPRCKFNYIFVSRTGTNRVLIHVCDVCTMCTYWASVLSLYTLECLPRICSQQIGLNTCPHYARTKRCLTLMGSPLMDRATHCAAAEHTTLCNLHTCPHLRTVLPQHGALCESVLGFTLNRILFSSAHIGSATHAHTFAVKGRLAQHHSVRCGSVRAQVCSQLNLLLLSP